MALITSAFFSLEDLGGFTTPISSIEILQWLLLPAIAALFVCPVAILICILRSNMNDGRRIATIALETTIIFAHLFTLLPMVH